jgi:hypothetical protein
MRKVIGMKPLHKTFHFSRQPISFEPNLLLFPAFSFVKILQKQGELSQTKQTLSCSRDEYDDSYDYTFLNERKTPYAQQITSSISTVIL